jgi:hypothetical protein
MKLALVVAMLCAVPCVAQERPAEDWKSLSLSGALGGAAFYDGVTTHRFDRQCQRIHLECGFETDPAARFALGLHPAWFPTRRSPGMLAAGSLEVAAAHFVAKRMRHSENRWARRIWWAPEVGLITVHLWEGSRNLREMSYVDHIR